tara:strand:+ start:64 stop:729 length:666 start_codon:yes stop_codon:yes gene_type:complete
MKKILAVIPAKGKSTRLKNKNLRKFLKSSLVEISIITALKSKYVTDVCVSSDSPKILSLSKKYPIISIKRPKSLCNNKIMPDDAVLHALEKINKNFDYVLMLQPTTPLRTTQHIDEAIKIIIKEKSDSLLSVFKKMWFIWKKRNKYFSPTNFNYLKRPRSQDFIQYQENGAIYITKPKIFKKNKNRLGGKISVYKMDFWNSFDIDTIEDFKKTEKICKFNF